MTALHPDLVDALLRPGRVLRAHGTGNDFVVLLDPDDDLVDLPASAVAALCDRHTGVGGDGVIRLGGPPPPGHLGDVDVAGADVTMDYRNADGGVVEMCGNGVRVVAKLAVDTGMVDAASDTLAVATRDGLRHVRVHRGSQPDGPVERVTVDMGPPSNDPVTIGLDLDAIEGDVETFRLPDVPDLVFAGRSMGNPHAIARVDDVAAVALADIGPRVERHAAFRDDVNLNVVQVLDDHHVALRVWERGVGETMACGTGACATVAALATAGGVLADDRPVVVSVGGGDLSIVVDDGGHLLMTGPAEVVGTVDLDAAWVATHLS
ncbi:diaminopimelate epimerase [Salsipaludibacter albus]|uniref:diaminopimelate epimerase n=1 Tax=Salsipaludibacter albus TaxID=2849650 RepID=UPI001EE4AA81|nr:diaminopimelate epimerase [Salsipaludibacter albus]MBY5163511.1 diaminopimelate epimerase [Salsipaludibacter albus]